MSCPAPASIIMHSLCMQKKKKGSKRPRLEGEEDGLGGGGVGRFLGIGGINHISRVILRYSRWHVIP